MDPHPLQQLYPPCQDKHPTVPGLYLSHRLDQRSDHSPPFVYTNYVLSLDGRIALKYPHAAHVSIPPPITSSIDWRLYQELAAQADVLLTSGRYIRELAAGEAQSTPPVSNEFPDLIAWRQEQDFESQPALVILSRSLELPLDKVLPQLNRTVYVATGPEADKRKLAAVVETGVPVLLVGENHEVDGCQLIEELGELGYHSIYAIAGAGLLNTLLRAGKVDRLYLTQVHTLLGGQRYTTLLEDEVLEPDAQFELEALYFEQGANNMQGQFFAIYDKTSQASE